MRDILTLVDERKTLLVGMILYFNRRNCVAGLIQILEDDIHHQQVNRTKFELILASYDMYTIVFSGYSINI